MITDLGVLEPDPETRELTLTGVHEDVSVDQATQATGWALRVADHVRTLPAPSPSGARDTARSPGSHAGRPCGLGCPTDDGTLT